MQTTVGSVNRRARSGAALAMMVLLSVLALAVVAPAVSRAATVGVPTIGATQTVAAASELNDVACPTTSTCYAVGTGSDAAGNVDGVVVTITDGVAGTPVPVPGGGATELMLAAISCPSVSTCYAVGSELAPIALTDSGAEVVTISGGTPAAAVPAPPSTSDESYALFNDIACTSATSCVAVGEETNSDGSVSSGASVPISNGTPGTLVDDADVNSLNGVWCTATVCQAGASMSNATDTGTSGGLVALTSAAAPSAPQPLASLEGVGLGVCPAASTTGTGAPAAPTSGSPSTAAEPCLALGFTGADATDDVLFPITSQTAGTAVQAPDLIALTCATSVSCIGVGASDDGTGVATAVADGTVGTPVEDVDPNVDGFDGAACASATSCVAVGVGDDNSEGVVVPITLPAVALPPGTGTGAGTGGGSGGSGGASGSGGTGSGPTTAHLTVSDVKVKGPHVTLRLSCSDAARCSGAVTETIVRRTTAHRRRGARTIEIGRDAYGLPAGGHVTKQLTLDPTGRHDLADASNHELRSRLVVTLGSGTAATTVSHRTVTLRPEHRSPARARAQ